MIYYLMHMDTAVALIDINPDGSMSKIGKKIIPELIPLQDRKSDTGLISWWRDRAVPISQGKIEDMLKARGLISPGDYLVRNLGLSLTDTYWIKPVKADYGWKEVNLFSNEFRDNIMIGRPERQGITDTFSPNSSLQGELEKTWVIDSGTRRLIKGNHGELSIESINEFIISSAHASQGFKEHVSYELIHIKGKDYKYGCISDIFTSESLELVSAYAVISSEAKPNHLSVFEHFITLCVKNGLSEDYVRGFLDYQIKMDYIFSNRDRHLNNIAVLRDTNSLRFKCMAPVFDSGKSMYVGKDIRKIDDSFIDRMNANGFAKNEQKLLKLVGNGRSIDIDSLPSRQTLSDIYHKDTKISDERINFMTEIYSQKVQRLDRFME